AFTGALRRAGMPVSSAETVDAARAIGAVGLLDREDLREAFAATLCKRPAYRVTFDTLFDLYFPPRIGDGLSTRDTVGGGDGPAEALDGEGPPLDPDAVRDALRSSLRDLLLNGDDDALRRLARDAVAALGAAPGAPGRQSWFLYRVLRALSPDTMIADLL